METQEAYVAYLRLSERLKEISAELKIALRILRSNSSDKDFEKDYDIYLAHLRELEIFARDYMDLTKQITESTVRVQSYMSVELEELQDRIVRLTNTCDMALRLILAEKSGNVVVFVIRVIRYKFRG